MSTNSIQLNHLPSDKITIFDLKCNNNVQNAVSPWGRVVINAARVKNIPFHLEHVEMVDVPALSRALGTKLAHDTDPVYTLPAIYDQKTKISLADSLRIVQYFDNKFPDCPRLVPQGTVGLVVAFLAACRPIDEAAFPFILPCMLRLLEGTKSEHHFRTSRMGVIGGRDINKIAPTGEEATKVWAKIKTLFDRVDSWYGDNEFIMGGDLPTYADLSIAGRLWWYRSSLGIESQEWQTIASWNLGRWGRLIAYFGAI